MVMEKAQTHSAFIDYALQQLPDTQIIRLISEKFGVAKVKISELRVYLISGYPPLGWEG